jgi:hypothetical protein
MSGWDDFLGAIGLGGTTPAAKTTAATKGINDESPQNLPDISNILGNVLGNQTWDQNAYDMESKSLDPNSPQAQYEAQQKAKLDEMRQSQGEYEASQQPSWYEDLYKGALNKVGGAGKFLGSDTGKNLASAGLNIGAGLIGQGQLRKGQEQYLGSYDEALKKVQDAQKISGEAYGAVKEDPEQLAMRQMALKGLSERAGMGLTPEDQAALSSINRQAANQFQSAQANISQDQARRGVQLGGLGLAQSMGAADQALQNQALAGQNQAAQSFAAKQTALQNLGNQTNQALQSDYARQMGKAENLSAVNKFNAQQQAQANQSAANAMLGKGQLQQQVAAGKAASTGQIGQTVAGVINPNKPAQQKKPGQV